MQTKAFAIIAAASLAIVLGTAGGNSQDDLEAQGKQVCRQSLLRLAHLGAEANPVYETVTSLMNKPWQQMSLIEKRIYVRALATVVDADTDGLEIMTLRKVNNCPQHPVEKPWDTTTEKYIGELRGFLTRAQIALNLEEIGE